MAVRFRDLSPNRSSCLIGSRDRISSSNCDCNQSRQFQDVRHQLSSLREEMAKKDIMIRDLCTMNYGDQAKHVMSGSLNFDDSRNCRCRLNQTSLGVQNDAIQDRFRRVTAENDAKEATIKSLRSELELLRQENSNISTELRTTREELCRVRGNSGTIESLQSRNEVAYQALQERYTAAQDQIRDLERRLLGQVTSQERHVATMGTLEGLHADFLSRVSRIACVADTTNVEAIIQKMQDMAIEHGGMTAKVESLEAEKVRLEEDLAAARDSITRVTETGFDQMEGSKAAIRRECETRIALMEARIESTEALLNSTKEDLASANTRVAELEVLTAESTGDAAINDNKYIGLVTSLSKMLTTSQFPSPCADHEGAVKERLRATLADLQVKSVTVDSLNDRIQKLQSMYGDHVKVGRDVEDRNFSEVFQLRDRIKHLENELLSRDLIRGGGGPIGDMDRIVKRLQRLAEDLKVDYIREGVTADEIISKLHTHLVTFQRFPSMDQQCACQPNECACTQQRRQREVFDQLASKDEQLNRLRRRLQEAEEALRVARVEGEMAAGRRACHEETDNRKLRHALSEAEQEICRLKQELLYSKESQVACLDQNMELYSLHQSVGKLEDVRHRQARKIAGLRCAVANKELQGDSATSEARETLIELRQRERQLVEFRGAVARLAGFDGGRAHEADILDRLERLINANQKNSGNTLQRRQDLIESDFQPGFGMKVASNDRMFRRQNMSPNRLERSRESSMVKVDDRKY